MKINISLFVISLALAGCAAQPAKNLDAPVTVKTTTEGQFVLAAAQAGKPTVKVDFKDNPELGAQFERDLASKGYPTAADVADADVVIDIDSAFAFKKPQARQRVLSVGKLFAHQDVKPHLDNEAERATRTTGFNPQNIGMATDLFIGTSIFRAIAEMTGIRGGINKALVGDERGVCLANCEKWHVYNQRLVLKANVKQRGGATSGVNTVSTTEHERLVPIELYEDARSKFLTALTGS